MIILVMMIINNSCDEIWSWEVSIKFKSNLNSIANPLPTQMLQAHIADADDHDDDDDHDISIGMIYRIDIIDIEIILSIGMIYR